MKLSTIFLFLSLLFSLTLKAQYGGYEPTGYFGISAAYVSPGNDFKQQAFYKPNSGFAKPGYGIELTYSYKLIKQKYGIAGMANFTMGSTDIEGMKKNMPAPYIGVEVLSNNPFWRNGNILFGPYAHFRIMDRLAIDMKLMGGINFISLSDYYYMHDNTNQKKLIKEGFTSIGIAYDFAIGLNYSITPSTFLLLDIDFLSSHNTKENIQLANTSGDLSTAEYDANIGLNMVSFRLGFAMD